MEKVEAVLIANELVEFPDRETGATISFAKLTFAVEKGDTIDLKVFRTQTPPNLATPFIALMSGEAPCGQLSYEFRHTRKDAEGKDVWQPKFVSFTINE